MTKVAVIGGGHIGSMIADLLSGTGEYAVTVADRSRDAALLYDKLEGAVIPTFYRDRGRFVDIMVHCIGLNGSFFNTHRMLEQYVLKAYYE